MNEKEKEIVEIVSKKSLEMLEDVWKLVKNDPNIPEDVKEKILEDKKKTEKQINKAITGQLGSKLKTA
ncbi:MAG: hypothetical protein LBI77_01785 [Puniceicoccales bacterium]|jgi:hypothetical protein|nr:hypothetical protein [Puniceicoccales bacterium]